MYLTSLVLVMLNLPSGAGFYVPPCTARRVNARQGAIHLKATAPLGSGASVRVFVFILHKGLERARAMRAAYA